MKIDKGLKLLEEANYPFACQFFDQYIESNQIEGRLYRSVCYFHLGEKQNSYNDLNKFMGLIDSLSMEEKVEWINKWHKVYKEYLNRDELSLFETRNYKV